MILLAWRQLQLDSTRTAFTILAIAALIAVVLFLKGFEQGQYNQLRQIVHNRNPDLVLAQTGVTNFVAVRSVIPQLARAEVESIEGVVNAHPITAIPIIYNQDNVRTPVYVIVYDTLGGPANIIDGQSIISGQDIVIDYSLAKKYNLKPGSPFMVTDYEFIVSGVTEEAALFMPFAFINYDGMIDLFFSSQIAPDLSTFSLLSYLLVELDESANREKITQLIESRVSSVDVFDKSEIAENDVRLGETFFAPIMGLLVFIGYVIGLLIVGLILFADISSRLHNFAILKALGFRFSQLMSSVIFQAGLLLVFAFPLAIILAQAVAFLIETLAPVYRVDLLVPSVMGETLTATFVFGLLGALLPLGQIRKCDPTEAFQAG